ncbi:hypothetical protein ACNI3K_02720 [Demequina sp. SO4-13]|uniref:hypothetical protein n=1 Tax=Demequina sp. SO4-13 TaxID=3401027 RepID=UPI003AF56704
MLVIDDRQLACVDGTLPATGKDSVENTAVDASQYTGTAATHVLAVIGSLNHDTGAAEVDGVMSSDRARFGQPGAERGIRAPWRDSRWRSVHRRLWRRFAAELAHRRQTHL